MGGFFTRQTSRPYARSGRGVQADTSCGYVDDRTDDGLLVGYVGLDWPCSRIQAPGRGVPFGVHQRAEKLS